MKVAELKSGNIVLTERENLSLDNRKGAIVKILGCGLCGTDIVKYVHKLSPDNTVLGHEIVGEIVEIDTATDFKQGDRIVSSHHIPCFECAYCKGESYSMCNHFKATNIFPGGFSEYIYLSEEHLQNVASLVPEGLSDDEAAFYEPLGCCIRAVKRADIKENMNVLVIGLGSIGIIMAQALKAFGAKVFGADLIEERIDIANSLGIQSFNSLDIEASKEYIYENTENIGCDAVFMTSGSDKAIDLAFKTVRNGGKILVFSSTPNNMGYPNNEIYYRELTVLGSYSPSPNDLKDSMKLLSEHKVVVKNLSTIYNLDEIQNAFSDTINNKNIKAYIRIGK